MTLDHGFVNTAACTSAITYIDGDAGILRYRGYPIEQLAAAVHASSRSSYLLIYGELPTAEQLDEFNERDPPAHAAARGPEAVLRRLPARRAPDAGAVLARCRALSTFYQDSLDPFDDRAGRDLDRSGCWPSCRRSPRTRTRSRSGSRCLYPDNSLSFVENFLRMTFGVPAEPLRGRPGAVARRWTCCCILHADHEQNCSTSTVRLVGSVARQPVRLGLGRHQRAVRPAARRRQPGRAGDARADPAPRAATSTTFVEQVKNKEDGVKLMGFGHRVYKNYDPRAAIVKKTAHDVLDQLGVQRPAARHRAAPRGDRAHRRLLRRAQALPERGLLHRPDLQGDGLPDARCSRCCSRSAGCPGWIAQWREMISDPDTKIGRPRQLYIGEPRARLHPDHRPLTHPHPVSPGIRDQSAIRRPRDAFLGDLSRSRVSRCAVRDDATRRSRTSRDAGAASTSPSSPIGRPACRGAVDPRGASRRSGRRRVWYFSIPSASR